MMDTLTSNPFLVVNVTSDNRASFIRKTYLHVAGAVLAFISLEIALLPLPITQQFSSFVLESQWNWLLVLGGFILASWLVRGVATRSKWQAVQ
jgi:uncharacterized protein